MVLSWLHTVQHGHLMDINPEAGISRGYTQCSMVISWKHAVQQDNVAARKSAAG